MAIERTELTETDDQKDERENDLREREERLAAAEKARHDAEVARARAEGEAEALKRGINTNQNQNTQWSDEQWEIEGQKRGMTGQQFKSTAELASGIARESMKPLVESAEEAKKEAREARAEMNRLKARKGLDSVASDFYDKNPALKAHRKTVDEFLATYPDNDNVDADTYQKRLTVAQDYVKGKIKETMKPNRSTNSGSSRLEGGDEREFNNEDSSEFDPKGTGNPGAAYLMAQVHGSWGQSLNHDDSVEVWKKSLDEEGRGVAISSEEDVAWARKMRTRQTVGGKRTE